MLIFKCLIFISFLLSLRTCFVWLTMQSYDGFWLIPNFFFHFSSKALDKAPGFGQIAETMSIPVQKIRRKRTDAETQGHRVICYFHREGRLRIKLFTYIIYIIIYIIYVNNIIKVMKILPQHSISQMTLRPCIRQLDLLLIWLVLVWQTL